MTDTSLDILDDIFSQLTQRQIFLLGRMSAAHSHRHHMRGKSKESKADLVKVQSFTPSGVGDGLEDQPEAIELAATILATNVAREVEASKFYKKCKHDLIAADTPMDIVLGCIEMMVRSEL